MAHQKHTKTRECGYRVEERPTDKPRPGAKRDGRHAAYKQVVVVEGRDKSGAFMTLTPDSHGPNIEPTSPVMPKSVVSIDSFISSDDSDDEEHRLAQQEWEESLEQLAQIVSVVLLPFLGKWFGRRWSYWG